MLGIRPSRQIRPALPHQLERQGGPQPVDLGQVDAQHRIQGGPHVKGRGVGLLRGVSGRRQLAGGLCRAGPQPLQDRFDRPSHAATLS